MIPRVKFPSDMEKKLKAYPSLNDHGATCKGHQNWMLDSEFTKQEERDTLIKSIDNYLK